MTELLKDLSWGKVLAHVGCACPARLTVADSSSFRTLCNPEQEAASTWSRSCAMKARAAAIAVETRVGSCGLLNVSWHGKLHIAPWFLIHHMCVRILHPVTAGDTAGLDRSGLDTFRDFLPMSCLVSLCPTRWTRAVLGNPPMAHGLMHTQAVKTCSMQCSMQLVFTTCVLAIVLSIALAVKHE